MPRTALYPVNPADKLGVEDNCALLYLHEPGLLHNLRYRYKTDGIYTYTAFILIAVNPYQRLPELYSKLEPYRGKAIGIMPPHVYAIGDRAHRLMKAERHSQTCVISGESGSGKTESAKCALGFVAMDLPFDLARSAGTQPHLPMTHLCQVHHELPRIRRQAC